MPADERAPFDMREVIARLVDGSDLHEFKPLYGETLVCGFARIWGHPVAILANNGILFSESARKGAHFIELACQRGIPLLFLQNITGFMVGSAYEHGGIARDGAKLVTAVACAAVPKLTCDRRLVRGRQLRHVRPRLRAAVPVQLADVPDQRDGRGQAATVLSGGRCPARTWRDMTVGGTDPDLIRHVRARGTPYFASARLWDDGVLDPRETRRVLGLCLHASGQAPVPETRFGVFRM